MENEVKIGEWQEAAPYSEILVYGLEFRKPGYYPS